METTFWILTGIIVYTYFGYPLVVVLLSLLVRQSIRKENIEPLVTFLITAYDEEINIREKLENTLALDYPREKIEIIVASDGSDDATDSIVSEYSGQGVRLYSTGGRIGKTEAQNRAVRMSRGEIIVFSDGTTRYERTAIRKIVRNYADPRVGGVGGRFSYLDRPGSNVGGGTRAFWDYETFIKQRQTRIKTITGCSGCIYSVRRSLFEPLPSDIVSDLVEPLSIIEKGYIIVFEPEAFAFEQPLDRSGQEFHMRIRVISRGMRGFLYKRRLLNPFRYPFIAFQLISHKILRWFVPFPAVALYGVNLAIVTHSPFYQAAFMVQTLFYAAALLGLWGEKTRHRIKLVSLPFYFCIINMASIVALWRTIMNRKDISWKTIR